MEDPELKAMTSISESLATLKSQDEAAVARVLRWAADKFGLQIQPEAGRDRRAPEQPRGGQGQLLQDFEDLPSFFAALAPKTTRDKVLAVGYWLQKREGRKDLGGHEVNAMLKDLGHRIGNITDTFGRLIAAKPQLAVQVRKEGKAKQARKKYRITKEGEQYIERLLAGQSSAED